MSSQSNRANAGQALAVAIVAATISQSAVCMDVSIQPSFDARTEFDTNRRLFIGGGEDVFGLVTNASAQILAADEELSVALTPRVRRLEYDNDDNPDRTDLFADLQSQRMFERGSVFLNLGAERTGAILSELTETGLVVGNIDQDTVRASPGFSYQLTPLIAATVTGSWQNVSFDESATSRLFGFTFWSASMLAQYQWRPRHAFTSRIEVSNFDSPDTDSETRTYTVSLGWEGAPTETITSGVKFGVNHSQLEFPGFEFLQLPGAPPLFRVIDESRAETGYVAEANLKKRFETGTLSFEFARGLNPSSQGFQSISDDYRLEGTKRLTERLSLLLSGRYLDRTAEGDSERAAALDVQFIQASAFLSWKLSPTWRIQGGYRYQRRVFRDRPSEGHAVQLTVRFTPLQKNLFNF